MDRANVAINESRTSGVFSTESGGPATSAFDGDRLSLFTPIDARSNSHRSRFSY